MLPKRFYMHRDKDPNGVSGIGRVAWGVQFPDGRCVIRWCTKRMPATTVMSDSIEDLMKLHGHEGTSIRWLDS